MNLFNKKDGTPDRTFFDWMVSNKSVNPPLTSNKKAWLISEIIQKVNEKVIFRANNLICSPFY